MKKINKLLITSLAAIGLGSLSVNALEKEYIIKDIDSSQRIKNLITYNGKSHALINDSDKLYEIADEDGKIKLNETEVEGSVIDTLYKDYIYVTYSLDKEGKELCISNEMISGVALGIGCMPINEFPEEENIGILPLGINNKIYINAAGADNLTSKIYVYEKANKVKEFNRDDIINSVEHKEIKSSYLEVVEVSTNEDPIIVLKTVEIENDEEKEYAYVFDYNLNLLVTISGEPKINSIHAFYKDGKYMFVYEVLDNNFETKSVNVMDSNGKEINLLKDIEVEDVYVDDNFIVVSYINKEDFMHASLLYDNNLNLLEDFNDTRLISINKEIKNYDDLIKSSKDIDSGNYLLSFINESFEEKDQKLLTVNEIEIKKTNISGILKDKSEKPINGYTVLLDEKDVISDKNGYFNFENIEEGKHTLIIRNNEGKEILTKTITLIASTETKIEDDTIYFKEGEGINLNIVIDGDNVVLDSVTEYKTHNEAVPKTFDKINLYIFMISLFSVLGIVFMIKMKKIKYMKY